MFLNSIYTKQLQPGYNFGPVVFPFSAATSIRTFGGCNQHQHQPGRLQPDTLVPDTIVPDTLQPPYIPLEAANSCSWYVYLQPDIKQHQRQNKQHQPGRLQPDTLVPDTIVPDTLQPPYISLEHQNQEKTKSIYVIML